MSPRGDEHVDAHGQDQDDHQENEKDPDIDKREHGSHVVSLRTRFVKREIRGRV